MRVLAVVPKYPPRSLVGAWVATHRHLRHLAVRGHQVDVVTYMDSYRVYALDGVTVHPRGTRLPADVVVAHLGDNGAGIMYATRLDVPLAYMVHGLVTEPAKLTEASLAVFNAESTRNATPHTIPSIVCMPPTPVDEYRTTRGDRITIVNCSREKGIKTAWRCADQLLGHQFLGVKGGYGTTQEIPRSANFETIPSQPDMRTVYTRTRILLMPSQHETWGMVGVEAMCSGIPVIAHPTPGLRESLGTAGIFVDRDDVDAWCAEIVRLDDPHEYAAASDAALRRVAELDPAPGLDRFTAAVEALV